MWDGLVGRHREVLELLCEKDFGARLEALHAWQREHVVRRHLADYVDAHVQVVSEHMRHQRRLVRRQPHPRHHRTQPRRQHCRDGWGRRLRV